MASPRQARGLRGKKNGVNLDPSIADLNIASRFFSQVLS